MATQDSAPFERFDEIPDPALGVASRLPKEVAAPTDPSLTRAERRRRSVLVLALAVGWILLVMLKLGLRADFGAVNVAVPVALWIVIAIAGLFAALRPRERGLPPTLRAVQLIAVAVPVVFLASALVTSHDAEPVALTWTNSGACFVWASITAAGPFLLSGLLLRRSFLSAPMWRGAAVGAVCGLCAAAGIHLHCAMAASAHVILAHGFPIVSGGLLGALFGALRGRA